MYVCGESRGEAAEEHIAPLSRCVCLCAWLRHVAVTRARRRVMFAQQWQAVSVVIYHRQKSDVAVIGFDAVLVMLVSCLVHFSRFLSLSSFSSVVVNRSCVLVADQVASAGRDIAADGGEAGDEGTCSA